MEKFDIGDFFSLIGMMLCFVCACKHLIPEIKAHAEYRVVTASKALVWILVTVCFGMMGIGEEMEDYLRNAIQVCPWWYNLLVYALLEISLCGLCLLALLAKMSADAMWFMSPCGIPSTIWKGFTIVILLAVGMLILWVTYYITHFGYMIL